MKKFLFSLLTVAICFSNLSAQQLSYYTEMVGTPGQTFVMAGDTNLVFDIVYDPGNTGTGLIWNFQGLDLDELDTLNFQTPTGQEATDFPGINLTNSSNVGNLAFDRDIVNGLFLLGASLDMGGFPVSLNYNPPQKQLDYVNSVGTTFNTTSYVDEVIYVGISQNVLGCQVDVDSVNIKRKSDYTVNFDASGELRLPLDTFAYALCANTKEITLDSIFIYCPTGISGPSCSGFGLSAPVGWSLAPDFLVSFSGFAPGAVTLDSAYTSVFYVPYTISPVCIISFDYDSAYIDTNYYTARFKGTNTPDIGFEELDQISLNVYPNPTASILMLQTDAILTNATILIFNSQGQQVRTQTLNGSSSVDVSGLTNGMYYYQLAEGKKLLHMGKFIIEK